MMVFLLDRRQTVIARLSPPGSARNGHDVVLQSSEQYQVEKRGPRPAWHGRDHRRLPGFEARANLAIVADERQRVSHAAERATAGADPLEAEVVAGAFG